MPVSPQTLVNVMTKVGNDVFTTKIPVAAEYWSRGEADWWTRENCTDAFIVGYRVEVEYVV